MDEQTLRIAIAFALYGHKYEEYIAIMVTARDSDVVPGFLEYVLTKLGDLSLNHPEVSKEEYEKVYLTVEKVLDTPHLFIPKIGNQELKEKVATFDQLERRVMENTIRFYYSKEYAEKLLSGVLEEVRS